MGVFTLIAREYQAKPKCECEGSWRLIQPGTTVPDAEPGDGGDEGDGGGEGDDEGGERT